MDAGLELDQLSAELAKLNLSHFQLKVRQVQKMGIGGSQALVEIDPEHHEHHHRRLGDILEILHQSALDEWIQQKSAAIFQRLAEAEARVHRQLIEEVHFHEVGAMDAIIDVVGAVAGVRALGIETIICSAFHLGSGTVACAHGTLPVPAPATAELIKGVPTYASGVTGELMTPTGAAILTTLSSSFGPLPEMKIEQIGYGAGTSEHKIPNLLRLMIGQSSGYQKIS
jgi:uncharacterized protein (TIGR00299 family) protein